MPAALISFWTHMLAAVLFAALCAWKLRGPRGGYPLAAALGATALWAWVVTVDGAAAGFAPMAETLRNLVWLGILFMLMDGAAGEVASGGQRAARVLFASMAAVLGLQLALNLIPLVAGPDAAVRAAVASTAAVLRTAAAAGGLVLVHNVYGQAAARARGAIRLPMLGLAALWAYDLNLYTVAYLFDRWPPDVAAMRGAAAAVTAPLFALVRRRAGDWRIRPSRAATFQSLGVGAICVYFLVMTIGTGAGEATGWAWLRGAQMLLLIVMTAGAAVLIPSGHARARLRVALSKHLFQHRYDYRAEWLRFTRVMGEAGPDAAPVASRVLRAVADIVEAPAGLLLVPDTGGRFEPAARWNWPDADASHDARAAEDAAFADMLVAHGRVIDFASLRNGTAAPRDRGLPVPAAMLADARIWAGVPLIHAGRLTGLALLAAPADRRALDWEGFDLLRTAARGAASYLAEARGQEALAEAARFDEFNRRFAFILHDIKNLVSGLSLVARNAERHADNPAFRADMAATLRSSAGRMNDLLAKLSAHEGARGEPPRAVTLTPLLRALVASKARRHEVRLTGDVRAEAVADPAALEQALAHLVDNAIDASPAGTPVTVEVDGTGATVSISVTDRGAGMSADFVRARLFQPFASTKPGGFGVGAHQARALVTSMGGRLDVRSREGEGTRFTVRLPAADAALRELAA